MANQEEPGPVGSHRTTEGFCGCHDPFEMLKLTGVPSPQSPRVAEEGIVKRSD